MLAIDKNGLICNYSIKMILNIFLILWQGNKFDYVINMLT